MAHLGPVFRIMGDSQDVLGCTFLGVPIVRIKVLWGLPWGLLQYLSGHCLTELGVKGWSVLKFCPKASLGFGLLM